MIFDNGSPASIVEDGLAAGELRYQRCSACGRAGYFPRVLCKFCGSTALTATASSGRGVVYSVTEVQVRDGEPYDVVLVDLEEGFRVMSNVVGAGQARIGADVQWLSPQQCDRPRGAFTVCGSAS